MTGPRNDHRNANAPLEEAELCAAIWPRAAAAEMGALFGGMAVIGLENDNGLLAQTQLIDVFEQGTDAIIERGNKGGVEISRVREVLVVLEPFRFGLIGVMGIVHREVDEE